MSDSVPEHCPGTQSENAGKASACEGCPNQQICSTASKLPDPGNRNIYILDEELIKNNLEGVKNKLVVLSGKGGVGKSTVACHLAFYLAAKGFQVGLLDLDICGPSIPKITGTEGNFTHSHLGGISPVLVCDNLYAMSVGYLIESQDSALIWRGPKKNGLIKQFLRDVDWGELDFLVIDTPPGTSDEHLTLKTYVKDIKGAIVVTTPQDVATLDVKKQINFCRKASIPVLGLVENMKSFICPCCGNEEEIFMSFNGGGNKLSSDYDVDYLGSIILDPQIAFSCDQGNIPESHGMNSLVFDKILQAVQNKDE